MAINVLSALTTAQMTEGTNAPLIMVGYRGLLRDQLFNALDFLTVNEISPDSGAGSKIVKLVYTDEYNPAVSRRIGTEYTAKNVTPKTEMLELKLMGGAWTLDDAQIELYQHNKHALYNAAALQLNQNTISVVKKFTHDFIVGNSTTNALDADGADVYLSKFTAMDNKTPLALPGGVTSEANARQLEMFIKQTINKMIGNRANTIITNTDGLSLLQAASSWLYRSIQVIKLNDLEYDSFINMKIIVLDDADFATSTLAIGTPFYFMCLGRTQTNVNVIIPDTGKILRIKSPFLAEGGTCHDGYVEMIQCPNFGTSGRALARCFVNTTVTTPTSGGSSSSGN